jgi:DNA-binding NtrC family response regulator
MANVVFAGLEPGPFGRLSGLLDAARHEIQLTDHNPPLRQLLDADIVFAGGDRVHYLALLRRVRATDPHLPFVVVARLPETSDWLDALEAGATDYCAMPLEAGQLQRVTESALPRTRTAAA